MNYYKIIAWTQKMVRYQESNELHIKTDKCAFFIEGKEKAKECLHNLKNGGYIIESIKAITKEQYMKQEVNA